METSVQILLDTIQKEMKEASRVIPVTKWEDVVPTLDNNGVRSKHATIGVRERELSFVLSRLSESQS